MNRLVSAFLLPLVLASIASTVLFCGWLAIESRRAPHILDVVRLFPFMLLFQAVGLTFLFPIGIIIQKLPLSNLPRALLVVFIGAAIGGAVIIPITFGELGPFLAPIPMACGAISALIWFVLNQKPIRRT